MFNLKFVCETVSKSKNVPMLTEYILTNRVALDCVHTVGVHKLLKIMPLLAKASIFSVLHTA